MKFTRDIIYLVVISLLIALCGQLYYSYHLQPTYERRVSVHYNKEVPANEKLIEVIDGANEYVYFAIYTFTRTDIKDALLAANYRGVEVKGVIDKSQTQRVSEQSAIVKELTNAGITVIHQNHSAIMHLKTLVTEKAYFSGSYNWTISGTESNDEIIEIGYDEGLRQKHEKVLWKLFDRFER